MKKVHEITKELLEKIDGMEITWIADRGLVVPAKVIADIDIGLSIKPTITPEELLALLDKHWVGHTRTIKEVSRPNFCLSTWSPVCFKKSSISPNEYKYYCSEIEEILNNKKFFNFSIVFGVIGEIPICPFYN